VLVDLVVMVTSGGEAISDLAVLRNQPRLFGEVASNPTAWRTLEAIDEDTLGSIASARAAARATAWESVVGTTTRCETLRRSKKTFAHGGFVRHQRGILVHIPGGTPIEAGLSDIRNRPHFEFAPIPEESLGGCWTRGFSARQLDLIFA
jgi:hypothetical protein